ncbi:MAG: flippase-like domain-containing protein [Elusimicrobia bacterium]|nr:flippase-like domain-containing protein [Elusimicrobiota bacterium]
MSFLKKSVLAAGLAMLAYLLWKLDAAETMAMAFQVGWLIVPIMAQELGAHYLNALGWRLAFRPRHAGSFKMGDLLRYRIMGDGVNYLTPSATIAGEFARASLLGEAQPLPVRVNSVVAAKFTQAAGQLLFIAVGLGWAFQNAAPELAAYRSPARWAVGVFLAAAFCLYGVGRARRTSGSTPFLGLAAEGWRGWVSRMPGDLLELLADHPGRVALSTLCFAAGYAWNIGETWLIARALGVPLGWETALHIEVLSNLVDGLLFMVPAKAGTQEAGKTLIFTLLGLPPRAGLAFGLVRHARELAWAALGLAGYASHERSAKTARAALRGAAPVPTLD